MSDNLPPQTPPPGPPPGWERGPGQPVPQPATPTSGGGRKAVLLGGGLLLTGALVAGGIVGWNLLSGDDNDLLKGEQPSRALPADTLAYAAIDLDPSGKQKIEAIRTLRKFPAFKEHAKIGENDDVLERLFELAQEEEEECTELTYADDIDPWLGQKFAVAAIADGDETPFPVGVLQVDGEDEARAGIEKLAECGEDEPEEYGLAFVDDRWAVVGETQDQVDQVVAGVEDGTLQDDEEFQDWTEAAGEPGIVHLYAAAAIGPVLVEHADEIFGAGSEPEIPEGMRETLESFPGGAGSIRFSGGALEAEFVSGQLSGPYAGLQASEDGAVAVSTLPATTVAALGFGLAEGWADMLLDQMEPMFEAELGMGTDEALRELEKATGLTRDDIEALGGDSIALAVDADFDPAAFARMPDPSTLPIGLKIKGDTDRIEDALDKLRTAAGPGGAQFILSRTAGDYVVVSASQPYLDTLADDDGLGGEEAYTSLVGDDEPASVFFLSFDAGDHWLDRLLEEMGAPAEVADNVSPLSGLGVSGWIDGDVTHALVKLTTD